MKLYVFIGLLIFSFFSFTKTKKEDSVKNVKAYAFENVLFKGKYRWRFIYEYQGKPYFFYSKNNDVVCGSIKDISFSKKRPSLIFSKKTNEETVDSIIFFGLDFNSDDNISVFLNEEINKSYLINKSFCFKVSFNTKIKLKLERSNGGFSIYEFNFSDSTKNKFSVIELESPLINIQKEMYFDADIRLKELKVTNLN